MSELAHAGSFRDLLVYQKARGLASEIYRISNRFPKEKNKFFDQSNSKVPQFCGDPSNIRETPPEYFTSDH